MFSATGIVWRLHPATRKDKPLSIIKRMAMLRDAASFFAAQSLSQRQN